MILRWDSYEYIKHPHSAKQLSIVNQQLISYEKHIVKPDVKLKPIFKSISNSVKLEHLGRFGCQNFPKIMVKSMGFPHVSRVFRHGFRAPGRSSVKFRSGSALGANSVPPKATSGTCCPDSSNVLWWFMMLYDGLWWFMLGNVRENLVYDGLCQGKKQK